MDENGDRLPGIDDMELDVEPALESNMAVPHITADNAGGSAGGGANDERKRNDHERMGGVTRKKREKVRGRGGVGGKRKREIPRETPGNDGGQYGGGK